MCAQIGTVCMLLSYQIFFSEMIKIEKYNLINGIVSTEKEDFVIRNSFLAFKFKADDIKKRLQLNMCSNIEVVGIKIECINLKRRIIDAKECNY